MKPDAAEIHPACRQPSSRPTRAEVLLARHLELAGIEIGRADVSAICDLLSMTVTEESGKAHQSIASAHRR